MRHRGEDVTPAFLSALKLVAFVTCPLGIVLSGAAEPVVLVVFGERWAGMIGPLAVLGLWGAVKPIRNTIAWLLNSVGHQAVLGRISLVMLVILVPLVHVAASRGGITEVAWVVLAESVAATLALAWFARSRAGVPLARQWSAVAVVAVACPAAWVALASSPNATGDLVGVLALGLPLAAGLGAYLAVILLLDRQLPGHALGQARRMVGRAAAAPGLVTDVSVIVVAHEVRDEVLACLASVEEHAAPATCELLLVDNGSTDGTAEAVAEAFPAAEGRPPAPQHRRRRPERGPAPRDRADAHVPGQRRPPHPGGAAGARPLPGREPRRRAGRARGWSTRTGRSSSRRAATRRCSSRCCAARRWAASSRTRPRCAAI